jgi:hypothetical protein
MNDDIRKERSVTEPRDGRGRFSPRNPGRPRGVRNRVTAAAEAIIDDAIGDVAQRAVELALRPSDRANRGRQPGTSLKRDRPLSLNRKRHRGRLEV